MKEIWKDIKGYEGLYQVSNKGRIKSLSRNIYNGKGYFLSKEKILNGHKIKKGYIQVELCQKPYLLSRIVALTFIPNIYNKPQINHIDGNKENNCVENLEWVTNEENMKHAYATGLQYNAFGKEARHHKYTYKCNEDNNIKNMTAREIAQYINDNIQKNINIISTASNIRQRKKAFGLTFESEVVQ